MGAPEARSSAKIAKRFGSNTTPTGSVIAISFASEHHRTPHRGRAVVFDDESHVAAFHANRARCDLPTRTPVPQAEPLAGTPPAYARLSRRPRPRVSRTTRPVMCRGVGVSNG